MKKKCRICKQHKTQDDFWKDKSRKTGVCSICKGCYRTSGYGDKKREYLKKYMREYVKNPKNQQKLLARKITKKAINDGVIAVLGCKICGEKAEAHHPNYSNPYEIVWLCDLHHRAVHTGSLLLV